MSTSVETQMVQENTKMECNLMVNEHILSQIVNENEREVFKSMRTDMASAKALLNEEQFNTFMRAATINQTILNDASFRRMNSPFFCSVCVKKDRKRP